MKTKLAFISAILTLILALPVSAKPKNAVTIRDINYDVTVVEQKNLRERLIGLNLAAFGEGTVDCMANPVCEKAGLDGEIVELQQWFEIIARINIDHTSAGIVGRTYVRVLSNEGSGTFEGVGKVKGAIGDCDGGLCNISMAIKASSISKEFTVAESLTGKITFDPLGKITIENLSGVMSLRKAYDLNPNNL